jgi:hypothetical protein
LLRSNPSIPLGHETLLPAPHGDLALARPVRDRGRADAVRRHQHDARSPHMFLRAIPIRDDRRQTYKSPSLTWTIIPQSMLSPQHPSQPSIHYEDSFVRVYPLASVRP